MALALTAVMLLYHLLCETSIAIAAASSNGSGKAGGAALLVSLIMYSWNGRSILALGANNVMYLRQ